MLVCCDVNKIVKTKKGKNKNKQNKTNKTTRLRDHRSLNAPDTVGFVYPEKTLMPESNSTSVPPTAWQLLCNPPAPPIIQAQGRPRLGKSFKLPTPAVWLDTSLPLSLKLLKF